jgi:uncharacterized protein DUF6798
MSLFRFSIYPQLLTWVAVAWLACDARSKDWRRLAVLVGVPAGVAGCVLACRIVFGPDLGLARLMGVSPRAGAVSVLLVLAWVPLLAATLIRTRVGFAALGVALLVFIGFAWGRWTGLGNVTADADYVAMAEWARDPAHTPPGAVFLVPPDDQVWRFVARRAIVVNFKGVPQLSSEVPAWRDRLESVLDMPDLRTLPRPFYWTMVGMRKRYDALPVSHLTAVARRWDARYVLATHALVDPGLMLIQATGRSPSGHPRYFLYDLAP